MRGSDHTRGRQERREHGPYWGRGGGRGRGGKVHRASEEGLVCHSENCELSPAGPGQLAEDFKRREVSKAVF